MEISNLGKGLPFAIWKLLPQQVRRAMRLTALLLTVVCVNVSAHSYEQTVSFSGKNVSLIKVFASIEKQTGVSFFFNYAIVQKTKPVTLDLRNVEMNELLDIVLEGQGLSYYKSGKTIFIIKDGEQKKYSGQNDAAGVPKDKIDVKGKVVNEEGSPLIGASITVKDGNKSVLTDEKGSFEIKNIPDNSIIIISFVGYQKQTLNIDEVGKAVIVLKQATNILDQAQVIAYGYTTQRLSTSNIFSIRSADIERQPVDNPLLTMEGRVPGVFVAQANGLPGSGITVRVQGQNSINNGNDPLYVIDGVPYTSQMLATTSGGPLGNSGGLPLNGAIPGSNPLSYINPADIERIDVLKDADATAIYGSRAANGAILITTKTGKVGNAKTDINVYQGIGQISHKLHLLNTRQYLQMRHEALANDGLKPAPTDYDVNGYWDTTRNIDWQKALLGRNAQFTNANGSVSGGNSSTQYLVGGMFRYATTVFPGSFNDKKGSLHFSINTHSNDGRFHLQLSGNYMADDNHLPQVDLTNSALQLAPDAPPLYNKDGTINWMTNPAGTSTWFNPISNIFNLYDGKTNNLISNAKVGYKLVKGLEIKVNLGYTNLQTNEISQSPDYAKPPELRSSTPLAAVFSNSNINSWIVEPQLDYIAVFRKSKLEALVGSTIEQQMSNGQKITGTGYPADQLLGSLASATTVTVNSTIAAVYKYNALFGRLNYNFDDKYLIDLTGRRDGSSRFGPKNQFHDFEAVGIAWIFTNENFLKKNSAVISFGKVRGSYGTTGNDQIGDYRYLDVYTPLSQGTPYQNTSALTYLNLPNPYLEWEESKKLQFGLDLAFLHDRIIFNGTYAINRSSNQLLPYNLPIITGYYNVTENFPATVENRSLELALTSINIRTGKFNWTTMVNATIPRNKLVAFPNLANSSYAYSYVIGEPINVVQAFHYMGVNAQTGIYQFSDQHGNITTSPNFLTDRTKRINISPTIYGGLENRVTCGNFDLDFLFQFVKQINSSLRFGNANVPGFFSAGNGNQPTSVLGRWRQSGDNAKIMRFNSNGSLGSSFGNVMSSDAAFSDASFIRLKNVSLSWKMPDNLIRRVRMAYVRFYVEGQNLITITKYTGLDPETLSLTALPTLRVFTGGVQMGF